MFRTFHVLLTIFGLLACPINCMSQGSVVTGGAPSAKACSCCSPNCPSGNENSDSPEPGPNSPDGKGGSCVCDGSVGQTPRRPLTEDRPILSASWAFLAPSSLDANITLEPPFANRLDPSAYCAASGRELRVEIRSLLF